MELEITPEPAPEEREAIERAVALLLAVPSESRWWRAGLEEALESPEAGERDGTVPERAASRYSASSKSWSTSQGAKPWRR